MPDPKGSGLSRRRMASRGVRLAPEELEICRACAELSEGPVYLVGGAVRDLFLGRAAEDLDLACFAPEELSKELQRRFGGTLVTLDEQNGIFRLVFAPGRFKRIRQIDASLIQGRGIADDLKRRDFSINAMALELSSAMSPALGPRELLDPYQGRADLAKKIIRCREKAVLADDPLRLLRAFRIAAQLGFGIEPRTLKMIAGLRKSALKPAAERVRTEITGIFSAPDAGHWARLMDRAKILTRIFPEMERARSCATVYYGQGGVLAHSLATLERMDFLLKNIERAFPAQAAQIRLEIGKNNFGDASFESFLRLCAFLHDVAKPETAGLIDGRLRFFRHDEIGAERISALLGRLRFSRHWTQAAAAVVAHHLRPGNLAANHAVSDRAAYRFFRDLGPHSLALLLTCWADHASYMPEPRLRRHLNLLSQAPGTFGRGVSEDEKKTVRHLQVVSFLVRRLFDESNKAVPDPVVDGRDVMKILGIKPGPEVGTWLERVREAQGRRKIKTRAEALAYLSGMKSKKKPRL
ncbi:MAG TPA: HD domain-containing protein [Elusimicrobiota bacterium]|nr:HD domain-containing protein [Elusimicrobiota bacterium]